MAVTQEDVAALAGVSRKTVSNVVNRYSHVSRERRRRVDDAIRELGYVPNQAARSLRTGRTRTIQLVVPELDVPYFAELARHVVWAAEANNLSVVIRQTFGESDREIGALEGEFGDTADGTILSPVSSNLESIAMRRSSAPVVLVGELQGSAAIPHIGIDNEEAVFQATSFLLARGRRQIGFIGAQNRESSYMARMRRAGWERAMTAAGLNPAERLVRYTDGYHRTDGAEAMRDFLASDVRLDAVICATDLLALGAIRSAFEAGVSVPQDVNVIGFDDLDEGRYSVPSLSTIAPDKQSIARRAVERIVEILDAVEDDAEIVTLTENNEIIPFTLIVRESTS